MELSRGGPDGVARIVIAITIALNAGAIFRQRTHSR